MTLPSEATLRSVGVDVGGTFTDLAAVTHDEIGRAHV